MPDRAASSEDLEAQQRIVTPIRFDVVTRRAEETRFEVWHSSRSPLVQGDLVIVLARWKREQLYFQVQPRFTGD